MLYSIILLNPSAMMIASIEPATVKASCLDEAVSSSLRIIADLHIRSNKSKRPASIIKKSTVELPVHISCFKKIVRCSCDRITASRYTRKAFLLTFGLACLTISCMIKISSNDILSSSSMIEIVSSTNRSIGFIKTCTSSLYPKISPD